MRAEKEGRGSEWNSKDLVSSQDTVRAVGAVVTDGHHGGLVIEGHEEGHMEAGVTVLNPAPG